MINPYLHPVYTAASIAALFPDGTHLLPYPGARIHHVCIDSRKAAWQPEAIFIALQGARTDGHHYLGDAWQQGVRNFLIQDQVPADALPEANYIKVPDVLRAFHLMAEAHRKQYTGKVIAITGSNGKTWVKEWLYMLLKSTLEVYRSPGSYNSQIGVPLSVWNIPARSTLAIIEAGISSTDEMEKLSKIIRPDIVVFTHLGDAHNEGFDENMLIKLQEKLKLCQDATSIVFPHDEILVRETIHHLFSDKVLYSWSQHQDQGSVWAAVVREQESSLIHVKTTHQNYQYRIPFVGSVPVNNSLTCLTALRALGLPISDLIKGFEDLQPIDMRLKAEDGIQGCVLINDSYSLDLDSLRFALESLDIAGLTQRKTLILSDHADGRQQVYQDLAQMIAGAGIDRLVCIGREIGMLSGMLPPQIKTSTYTDVDEFFRQGGLADCHHEVILLKGARRFGFERIARRLRLRSHSAVLEVDFAALDHNLRYFYAQLRPGVKKIAVVKANAYGAGSMEVCRFLSWQNVDMLAVALIDEGIELRDAGITVPVIVLNPDPESMDLILKHNLEPEIYNRYILQQLVDQCSFHEEMAVIHIKLDTGTHRLGFGPDDLEELIQILRDQQHLIRIGSVFTHFSGSDDPRWDDFTHEQAQRFDAMYQTITAGMGYTPPRHVLSTTGILRFPEYQYEAVRMGIGLYGVGITGHPQLIPVHTLKARILHIQTIHPGETVSYARSYTAETTRKIATVNLGYADGLPRSAGDVGYTFLLHGRCAPITGRVCMDMTMMDISDIPEAAIGDEVIVFGKNHPIEDLARLCGTIPYEIMTHLHSRIRKIYEHG